LRLEVEGNGKGLSTEDAHANSYIPVSLGVGIPGMCERMRELGGSLRIQSSKRGTRVTAALSLTGEQMNEVPAHSKTFRGMRPEISVSVVEQRPCQLISAL
jgi:signal transduction histidine kinase